MNKRKYCTFYIVRHGQTEWNAKGKLQGHQDSPLTKKGIKQAEIVQDELKHIQFNGAFSSDLLRAKKTAEIIALDRDIAIKTTQLLREGYFGRWEGKPYSIFANELKQLLDEFLSLSNEQKFTYKFPDIESDEEVVTRCLRFLRETAVAYPNKTLLVGTHGGVMLALLIHLGFGTYDSLTHESVENTSYIVIDSDGVDFFIRKTKGITLKEKINL